MLIGWLKWWVYNIYLYFWFNCLKVKGVLDDMGFCFFVKVSIFVILFNWIEGILIIGLGVGVLGIVYLIYFLIILWIELYFGVI